MKSAIEIIGLSGLLPAAVSVAAVFLLRRLLPARVSRRYAVAVAFVAAFLAGYSLVPSVAWVPERHWHWLPYLGLAAAVVGPIAMASGVTRPESCLLYLLLAAVASWLLVPTWPSLEPSRWVYVPALTAYFALLTALLVPLPDRLPGPLLPVLLLVVSTCASISIAAFVSLNYGRVSGVAAAATAGCMAAAFFGNRGAEAAGFIPAFVLVVAGAAFIGCIEPQPPLLGLLVMPATPVALWLCVSWPLNRLRGIAAVVAGTAVVAIPLAAAAGWLVINVMI